MTRRRAEAGGGGGERKEKGAGWPGGPGWAKRLTWWGS
jgi:hypothetical protein